MTHPPSRREVERLTMAGRSCGRWLSARDRIFWKMPPRPSPSLRRYIQVLIRDIHLIKEVAERRPKPWRVIGMADPSTKGRQRRASARYLIIGRLCCSHAARCPAAARLNPLDDGAGGTAPPAHMVISASILVGALRLCRRW